MRWRVLRERVDGMLARAEQRQDDECVRLAALGLALLERHVVDARGRCRHCRATQKWVLLGSRRCRVLPVIGFYLEQPAELLALDREA